MNKQTGIWIDGKKAVIITLQNNNEIVEEIFSSIDKEIHHAKEDDETFIGSKHINNETKFNQRTRRQTKAFIGEVLSKASDADEIFIMGPSGMKLELRKQMQADRKLSSKFKGLENCDYITTKQMVAKVKDYYQTK